MKHVHNDYAKKYEGYVSNHIDSNVPIDGPALFKIWKSAETVMAQCVAWHL